MKVLGIVQVTCNRTLCANGKDWGYLWCIIREACSILRITRYVATDCLVESIYILTDQSVQRQDPSISDKVDNSTEPHEHLCSLSGKLTLHSARRWHLPPKEMTYASISSSGEAKAIRLRAQIS